MNQSNKKNLEFIINSGVNYYLQDSPRNWFENEKKLEQSDFNKNTGDKKTQIDEVIKDLKNHQTSLQKTATKLVVYDGNLNAKVMLIGEAPGGDEDQQGIPFVGRAGQLLNKMLLAINLQREDVYVTNVVNWRPPDNRTPNDNEILEFLPFLQRQIDIIKPKFIFLLGGVAAKAILSTPLTLGKLRGKWHEYKSLNLEEGIPTIASYHPAFLLRSPQYKKHSWEDLQMLQEKLQK